MDIKESQASLTSQFLEMVTQHCPGLVRGSNPYGASYSDRRFYIWLWTKKRWFHRQSSKLMVGPTEPFEDAIWEDLEIKIFDGNYLDGVTQLAADYQKVTGKRITIIKEY